MTNLSDTKLSDTKQPINKSNVLTFWMIVLVFALPPIAAYFMYYSGIMPEARMNNGILVQPKELPDVMLQTIDNKSYAIKSNSGKWTLLMLIDSSCDDLCKKNIYLMRQVRISLGKDSHNTERLLIRADTHLSSPASEALTDFLRDYPSMPVVTGSQDDIQVLSKFFVSVAGDTRNKVFLIDPDGKVMMHYEQELQPKYLLSDLKRLILVNSNDLADNTK